MESQKKMWVVFGLVAAAFLQSAAAQTAHVVGDSMGWTIPNNGASDYVTWASGQKFAVGDILIFNFASNAHDVVQVPKASFDSCSSTNAIGSSVTTGPANITLTSSGDHYYICSFGRHCASGQKLAITVSASSTAPGASPSSPSPSTTTSEGPTMSTTPGSTTMPPSSSSTVTVGAGVALCFLSLVMGFFF